MTKTAIVPNLPEEDRIALVNHGISLQESSAKDRFCVMCPLKRGSTRRLPCCLCNNWCHIGCSYILDPRRKIMVLRHPYHEDCMVLPTRTTIRPDTKSIAREVVYQTQPDDTSLSWRSPASWLNTLLEKQAWLSAPLSLSLPSLSPSPSLSLSVSRSSSPQTGSRPGASKSLQHHSK